MSRCPMCPARLLFTRMLVLFVLWPAIGLAQPAGPGGGAFWNQPVHDSWFNPFRWNGVLPFQGGVPDATVTAHISHQVQVDILGQGQDAQCHHLSLGQFGVGLRIAGSSTPATLTVHGTQIDNFGAILVGGDDALRDSRFVIAGHTNANGTGTLTLRAPANHAAQILPANNLGWLLVNWPSHTIQGNGEITVNLQNDGLIHANRNGRALVFNAAHPVQNNGVIRASNGGVIRLTSPNGPHAFVQSGGGELLIEPASTLELLSCGHAGLRGGLVHGGGQVVVGCQGFPIESVELAADMEVVLAGNSGLVIGPDGIDNHGLIRTGPTGYVRSRFGQSASVGGTGRLQLEGGTLADLSGGLGYALVNEAGHTISGVGTISLALTNRGEVVADRNGQTSGPSELRLQISGVVNEGQITARDGGTVNIEAITVDQSPAGQVRALHGSSVIVGGAAARIRGGSLATSGTGRIYTDSSDATLQNLRIEAGSEVVAGCARSWRLEGAIDHRGRITVDNAGCGPAFATLQGVGNASVSGSGEIRLQAAGPGTNANLSGGNGQLTLGSDQLLTGTGRLVGALRLNGVVMPDQPFAPVGLAGALTADPGSVVTMSPSTRLVFDLAPAGQFDRIDGNGTIVVGGTLEIQLADGFVPVLGQTFDLITGTAVSGSFHTIRLATELSAMDGRVDVFPDRVRLTLVPPPFRDGFEPLP